MTERLKTLCGCALLLGICAVTMARAPVEAPLRQSPVDPEANINGTLDWPTIVQKTLAWAASRGNRDAANQARAALDASPKPTTPRARHDRVIQTFARLDPPTAQFLTALDPRNVSYPPPDPTELLAAAENPFYRTNLAIEITHMLVDRRLYDEALAVSTEVDPNLAIDPATWLFYRAVCQHQLLQREAGLKTIAQLLSATTPIPESYRSVAELMKIELEALKPGTLGEIAGLMDDVERRLALARGGKPVQTRENEIADKLKKMIEKLKKQRQQQQQQQSQSGSGKAGRRNKSVNPLDDSIVKGSTAPGNVDDKGKMRGGDWGAMPPREREAAKIEIEKAFPSNYSRMINKYFLKRAREE